MGGKGGETRSVVPRFHLLRRNNVHLGAMQQWGSTCELPRCRLARWVPALAVDNMPSPVAKRCRTNTLTKRQPDPWECLDDIW